VKDEYELLIMKEVGMAYLKVPSWNLLQRIWKTWKILTKHPIFGTSEYITKHTTYQPRFGVWAL